MMKRFKILGFTFGIAAFAAMLPLAHAAVGNIGDTPGVERVSVGPDGSLYAWNKEGAVLSGWPKAPANRHFILSPRLTDIDLDLQKEVLAVSVASNGSNPQFHVFKGNGAELTTWNFGLPGGVPTETPVIADVTHDSSADITVAYPGDIAVYRRDFKPVSAFAKTFSVTPYVTVGDPNNDGRPDLYAASGNSIYSWDEFGTAAPLYVLPQDETVVGHVSIVDVNNDSYPDIVFVTAKGRILALDQNANVLIEIHLPGGVSATSEVVLSDVDLDRAPEFLVATGSQKVMAFKLNGASLTNWEHQLGFREGLLEDGVVADDRYQGLFGSASGWDQLNIYRNQHNTYSKTRLGDLIHEWDEVADFDFIQTIDVADLWSFPKPFTPNGDGVNDTTQIHYILSDDAKVALDLYDANERFISRIHDPVSRTAGEQTDTWSGMDTRGTATLNDDRPLDTGLYIIKVVAESKDGFVTVAKTSAIVNGVKAKIEQPADANEDDDVYPKVYGQVTVSGIATDPNFGESNLDADFKTYKLYYRSGVWHPTDAEAAQAGQLLSPWSPVPVPLRHQCPDISYSEPNDSLYPKSNVSCRPVQHGVLGTFDTLVGAKLPNGDYTLLLKVMDSNGNTIGKFNYDSLVVRVANPVAGDPVDPGNPYDPANPDNPIYQGPKLSSVSVSSATITKQAPTTTISYALANETSNVHITIYPDGSGPNSAVAAIYSFNRVAPNDAGKPNYQFTWDGTNTLGRNVSGGTYHVLITANAVDGTGVDNNDTAVVTVTKGFAASDVLAVADDTQTGQSSFLATPSHFDPLGFGITLQPEKTTISYQFTKEAKVTVQVLEAAFGAVMTLQKTLVANVIQKSGAVTWDGSGDNGAIIAVGKDYTVRLIAQGIDVGNEETVVKDITVHLDDTTADADIAADITQMVGDDGEDATDDQPIAAMRGNPNFLWRAAGSGVVEVPFTYAISASGMEKYNAEPYPISVTKPLYLCKVIFSANETLFYPPLQSCAKNYMANHPITNANATVEASVPAPYSISSFEVSLQGVNASISSSNFKNTPDEFALNKDESKLFSVSGSSPLTDPQKISFNVSDVFWPYEIDMVTPTYTIPGPSYVLTTTASSYYGVKGCVDTQTPCEPAINYVNSETCPGSYQGSQDPYLNSYYRLTSGTLQECGSIKLTGSATGNSVGERTWPPTPPDPAKVYSISGNANISTPSNPVSNLASYTGQVGSGQADMASAWITAYGLTLTNQVNGVTSTASSTGSTVDLPGLQGWLTNGVLSAQIVQNGGVINSYVAASHDPYLAATPYQKIWGDYKDFGKPYFQRFTKNISIYNDGYTSHVFSGNPGTKLYSFSNVVHLTNWGIDVRYPNVATNKADGDNLLDNGSNPMGIFHVEKINVTASGVNGTQNSNISDTFQLRLLPDAVPHRFIEIHGSAAANYELYYYDATETDPKWHAIPVRTSNPVSSGILAHWDVTTLNGNQYTVVVKSKSGNKVNIDKMDVGIGQWVDTDTLSGSQFTRVESTFGRAALIFGAGALNGGPSLVTITPVKKEDADFKIPSGVAPLGPIFNIKPDNINIDPKYHVQLEITFTPAELQEAFGVADASELTIYNLAGDETLEGLATIATLDTHDDSDPANDVWRFTANLEHFSQYFLAKKVAGYIHVTTPTSGTFLSKTVTITGRVESAARTADQKTVNQALAAITGLTVSYFPAQDPKTKTTIFTQTVQTASTTLADINIPWDVAALNGNYVLRIEAMGPAGATSTSEIPVAIDNQATQSGLILNGQAVADGSTITVAPGVTAEIVATDAATNTWASGVQEILYSVDGAAYTPYTQPFNLFLGSGDHALSYYAVDQNGNEEAAKVANLKVQEATASGQGAPTVQLSISGPTYANSSQTWVSSATQVALASAGAGVDHVSYRVGDGDYVVYSQPFSITTQATGTYAVEYFAVTDMGLRGEVYRKPLLYDVDAPMTTMTINGLSTRDGATLVVAPESKLVLTATDFGEFPSGVDRIETKWNLDAWKIYKDPLSFTAPGTLSLRAVDHLGNTEKEQATVIKVDDVKPALAVTVVPAVISPNGDGRHDTAPIVVSATDNLYKSFTLNWILTAKDGTTYAVYVNEPLKSGTNTLTWDGKVDGKLIPEGHYTYVLTIADAGGNISDSYSGTLTDDVTPPVIVVKGANVRAFSPNGDTVSDVLQVDYTVTDTLFTTQIQTELAILTKGQYELLKTMDSVATPPIDHILSWNGSDAIDNGVFDGDYNFQLTAEDPAGNRSAPQDGTGVSTGDVFVDRFPPLTTLSIVGLAYNGTDKTWLGKDAKVALQAIDPPAASGVDKVLYGFSDKELQTYSQPFALAADNIDYTLYYQAKDVIGNAETIKTKKLRSDSNAPNSTLTIGTPKIVDDKGAIWIAPKTPLSLAATDTNGVGVRDIFIEVKGARASSIYQTPITLDGLADGLYQILTHAEDNLDNKEATKTQELHLDVTPPKTSLVIGSPQSKLDGDDTIYISSQTPLSFAAATERGDLKNTEYRINDGAWQLAADIVLPTEGNYTVYFRSYDTLGNIEPEQHQILVVDNTPPAGSLSLSQSAGGAAILTPGTLITLGATDGASTVSVIEYQIDGGEFTTYTGPFSLRGLTPGMHVITYRVRDHLGNISQHKAFALELVDVTVTRETFKVPRILVFMLQTQDLRATDPRPNANLLQHVGQELGGYITVVDGDFTNAATVEKFISEMRSDNYTTFIFATDSYAVRFYDSAKVDNMMRELKARIYKGDTFISMAGYSDVQGDTWTRFHNGFTSDGKTIPNATSQVYGQGKIVEFATDIGRAGLLNPTTYAAIQAELEQLILDVMPAQDENNAGEATDFMFTYYNSSDQSVQVTTTDTLPLGWVDISGSDEVLSPIYQNTLTVPARQSAEAHYLYRPSVDAGDYSIVTKVVMKWANGLVSEASFTSPYKVERSLVGLIDSLVGPEGLLADGSMPLVKEKLLAIKRRIFLENGQFNPDENANDLVAVALDAIDALSAHPRQADIHRTLSEIVEGIGTLRFKVSLDQNAPLGTGNAADPGSYHGDTASFLGGGGGGCTLIREH